MTLIRYDEHRNRLTVYGHSGYAEKGADIVCAAVSALTYTMANALMGLEQQGLVGDLHIRMDSGEAELSCVPVNQSGKTALSTVIDTIMGGYGLIAGSHPEHVQCRYIKK